MEALLGAGQSNPQCASVADLQAQLRGLLSTRVTETHADHISVTFEIRATTVFDIPATETENEALENASNIDPLLRGVRASAAPVVQENGGPATRRVKAIDTLVNQPTDDPVLQTSVTRHIIASLGQVDGSKWTVRQVSRGEQGWAFTYICKDSWQAWSRQTFKHPPKTAIAEWSEKGGQDPTHLARPAFDCRGCVKIAFTKSTKTIDVKYEHTPMHKTVAQLIELLAPPPPAPIIQTPAKIRAPKPPKEPKPKTPRSSKKRAGENNAAGGEGTAPKKRRKKKDSLAPAAPDGTVLPPEMPGALPVGDAQARPLYNTAAGPSGSQPSGPGSYPEGLVGAEDAAAAASDEVHMHSILNLPPGEAARRRDVAIRLLNESNIDPKTLSAEQFNIFANQSPELQQDSLAMLIKYGAERLRVVHPNKDGSSPGQATPDKQRTSGSPGEAPGSAKPKKPRKQKSDGQGAGVDGAQDAETATVGQRRICDHCRERRYKGKCDKAKPSCSMCIADGVACVYSAPKPRRSRAAEPAPEVPEPAGAAMPGDEERADRGPPGLATEPAGQPVQEAAHEQGTSQPLQAEQGQYEGHAHQTVDMAASEPAVHQVETPSDVFNQTQPFYQQSSDLSFPQIGGSDQAQSGIASTTMGSSSMEYMPNTIAEAPDTTLHNFSNPQPPEAQASASGYGEQTTAAGEQHRHDRSSSQASSSRRSLPTGQPSHGSATGGAAMNAQSTWQSMSGSPTLPAAATKASPRQARVKKPSPVSQAHEDLRQQQALSWATAGQSVTPASQPARNSPSQAVAQPARSRSRQSNRSQGHASVSSTSSARQVQPQGTQSLTDSSGYASTAAAAAASAAAAAQQPSPAQNYDSYDQYQSGSTQAGSTADRINYQSYTANQASAQSTSYPSFNDYSARASNAAAHTLSMPESQNVASSYPSGSSPSTAQWEASAATSRGGSTRGYMATQSAAGHASYNMASTTSQPQALQGLGVRPQPPAQARAPSTAYSQQLQQQQQRQQQGHRYHQSQQQQPGYSNYASQKQQQPQPQQQQQQQQQQQTSSSQQNWYGYGAAAPNRSATGYSSAAAAGTSHAPGHQAQHHRSMNLSSHTYSSMDGDQSLYDLLRNNPAG